MKSVRQWISAGLALVLALSLSGCTIPMPGFADYDVSGYIQALLDSSYKNANANLIETANITEEKAMQNNISTVENAAINFCNTYGVYPSDEQLIALQEIMKQAFQQAKYTVKDEQKVDTGYYLEVEITPIVNFSGCGNRIAQLKEEAQNEVSAANIQALGRGEDLSDGNSSEEEDGWDEESSWDDGNGEENGYGEENSQEPAGGETLDANEVFVEKVLEFCRQEVQAVSYDSEPRTIALDIRQTEAGELQLDTNQLDTIDRTVIRMTES